MTTKFSKWLPTVLTMAGLALLGTPRSAHALLTLRGFAGTDTMGAPRFTAQDGGAGKDIADGVDGRLELATQTILGLSVSGSLHTSNAMTDDASGISGLTSGSSSVENTSGGTVTVTVEVSDTGFGSPGRIAPVIVLDTASGTFFNILADDGPLGSSVTASWFLDPNNALFGTTGTMIDGPAAFLSTAEGTNSYSYNKGGLGPFGIVGGEGTGLFSMTERFTITLTAGTQLTSRGQNEITRSTAVPEPTTLAMALGGLPILGACWLRRRRQA